MDSDSWEIRRNYIKGCDESYEIIDARDSVVSIEVRDRMMYLKIRSVMPVYTVYQALLDIPWETAGRYIPVCTEVESVSDDERIVFSAAGK